MCVHIHPIIIKIHPVFFLNPYFKIHFLLSGCFEISVRMTLFCTSPSHKSWLTRPTYHRPALRELRAVHQCIYSSVGGDKMSPIKRLRCFVVDCNNEYSSRHLLPTSEPLKAQHYFRFEVNAPIPNLPKCIYVRTNHLWSSLSYRKLSKTFFYESSPFLIMC